LLIGNVDKDSAFYGKFSVFCNILVDFVFLKLPFNIFIALVLKNFLPNFASLNLFDLFLFFL